MSCEPKQDWERDLESDLIVRYSCKEKFDLGACNVPNCPCDNPTEGVLPEPARKTMFPAGTIETYSGKVYDFANPDPMSVTLDDIAHALSQMCRFAGHTKRFASVAEHSVLVSLILEAEGFSPDWALLGLMHDGHEAYVWDAPRPLKPLLGPAFEEFAAKADVAIEKKLLWPGASQYFKSPHIKKADNIALVAERKLQMFNPPEVWEQGYEDVPDLPAGLVAARGLGPAAAEGEFLRRYDDLQERI